MVQIGGYLSAEEHAEFKRYAAQFHLKESSLANLLIARELRLRRLTRLAQAFTQGSPLKKRARITAHQADGRVKEAFEALAHDAGVSPDQAAAVLYRAELTERWLAKSIDYDVEESI
jgi:hypothetical protein